MSIEFRCGQCGKLLRTGDETAGKQAKCPSCGAVQPIPTAWIAAPLPPPHGGESMGNPFGASASPPSLPATSGEVNPYQSPASALLGPAESYYAPAPGTRTVCPTKIDIGDVIRGTWEIATKNTNQFLMCFLVMLTCVVLNWAAGFIQQMILLGLQAARLPVAVAVSVNLALSLAGVVLQMWLTLGQTLYFIRTARGEETPFGLVFSGAPYLVRTILASLLIGFVAFGVAVLCAIPGLLAYWASNEPMVGIAVGVALFIAPSLYIGLTYYQFQYFILDCDLGVMDSLQASKQVTTGNRMALLAVYLLAGLASAISAILCCLPLLFMIPFVTLGAAVVYLKMSGQVTADVLLRQSPITPSSQLPEPLR